MNWNIVSLLDELKYSKSTRWIKHSKSTRWIEYSKSTRWIEI
jgi:hypothetical protein